MPYLGQFFRPLKMRTLCFACLLLFLGTGVHEGSKKNSRGEEISSQRTQQQLLEEARQLISRKNYSDAACIFRQILRKDPQSFQALNGLGIVQTQMGDYARAVQVYEKALAIAPSSFPLLLNIGICYFKVGKFFDAARYLKQAVAAQPPNFQARSLLAMSYYAGGDFKRASIQFKKLIAIKPGNQTLQYLLAQSYLRSGSYNEFLNYFQQVLKQSPNSVALHMLMGEANDGLDRTSEAIKQFQIAASLAPNQPDVHFGLGYLYWKNHEYDKATAQFRREIQAKGSVAKSKAYLGDIALREDRNAQARTLLEEAMRSYLKIRIAYYDLGILDIREKKYDQAIVEFRNAIKMEPNRADAHYRLAEVYRAQGNEKLAQQELNKVSHIHTKKRDSLLHEISGPARTKVAH